MCLLRLLACAVLATTPAAAASLRPLTTLAAPVVRLADLFDDAGPGAERVLGPAPAPGARLVVEAPQLAAIARQFDVAWQPASPMDRVVLDRPGRMLPRDTLMQALRAALAGVGAPDDMEIDLPGFASPMVAPEARPRLDIEQLDWDAATGRFAATLSVSGNSMATQRMRLVGTVQEMVTLPVAAHRLPAGAVIAPDDLLVSRVRTSLVRGEAVHDAAQAIGMTLRRPLVPGQPLPMAEISRTATVLKGARITMQLASPGLTLVAQGTAIEEGRQPGRPHPGVEPRLPCPRGGRDRRHQPGARHPRQRRHVPGFQVQRTGRSMNHYLALLLLPVVLTACGSLTRLSEVGRPPEMSPIADPTQAATYRPLTMPMPAPQSAVPQANALWRNGSRAFFERTSAPPWWAISSPSW